MYMTLFSSPMKLNMKDLYITTINERYIAYKLTITTLYQYYTQCLHVFKSERGTV